MTAMVATAERTETFNGFETDDGTALGRHLVTGGDPDAPFRAPGEASFGEDVEYVPAPELERVGNALIANLEELGHLQGANIAYCWRRKGGKTCGKPILAKCQKVSGLTKFYARADFVIAVAADFCREWMPTAWQVEALLHHELCHGEVDPESGKPAPAAHDAELFFVNVRRYGLWQDSITAAADAFNQMRLDGMER